MGRQKDIMALNKQDDSMQLRSGVPLTQSNSKMASTIILKTCNGIISSDQDLVRTVAVTHFKDCEIVKPL